MCLASSTSRWKPHKRMSICSGDIKRLQRSVCSPRGLRYKNRGAVRGLSLNVVFCYILCLLLCLLECSFTFVFNIWYSSSDVSWFSPFCRASYYEWFSKYERLTEMVVPRSTKWVIRHYTLHSVTTEWVIRLYAPLDGCSRVLYVPFILKFLVG